MTPAPIAQPAPASPSPPIQQPTPTRTPKNFDDIFTDKFARIIVNWKENPSRGQLTQLDRKEFIETAYTETDLDYFGKRHLSDIEIKLRALTKVFYKVLAEEPWKEDWLRAPDVERKLSKFEMHKDSVTLAAHYGLMTPKDAIIAAREALIKQQEATKPKSEGDDEESKDQKIELGPFDDIEIIYIAGTVSSTATNRIDRENIYPVSVSSVANVLQNHICREMIRPFTMAEKFVHCTDTKELEKLRKFACDVCDFCPHLLDNDNVTLLVVLLILSRSDCCRRFEANGIRIEGSTISHRKAECMKNKMGWKTAEEKKPFDNFANEFQVRVKNACFPVSRSARSGPKKPSRKSSTPATPGTPSGMYPPPHMGYMAPPQVHHNAYHVNSGINVSAPSVHSVYSQQSIQQQQPQHQSPSHMPQPSYSRASSGVGSSATEPMDLS